MTTIGNERYYLIPYLIQDNISCSRIKTEILHDIRCISNEYDEEIITDQSILAHKIDNYCGVNLFYECNLMNIEITPNMTSPKDKSINFIKRGFSGVCKYVVESIKDEDINNRGHVEEYKCIIRNLICFLCYQHKTQFTKFLCEYLSSIKYSDVKLLIEKNTEDNVRHNNCVHNIINQDTIVLNNAIEL